MTSFEQANCRGHIEIKNNDVTIKGTLTDSVMNGIIKYTAANPLSKTYLIGSLMNLPLQLLLYQDPNMSP